MILKYTRPTFFYPKQKTIFESKTRYTLTIASNKCGKSLLCACWINEKTVLGGKDKRYVWLSPFSKTSTIGYELVKKIIMSTPIYQHLKDIKHPDQFKFNSSFPQKIIYPNGSVIDFVQGLNIDALWGQQYYGAVVDECTRLKNEIIEVDGEQTVICPSFQALMTNLRITKGEIMLIGNPTTKHNFFWQWYNKILRGEDSRASAFHLSSLDAIEAGFLDQEDFDYAKEHESRYIFTRDWLGQIPSIDNSVFKADKVYECVYDEIQQKLSKVVYMGIDIGFTINNKSDYTVVCGLNDNGELKFFKRFKAEGQSLINKLKSYINNRVSYIDATAGGGHTIYSLLIKDCPQLEPFKFNNKNKCSTIETLAHYIHTNQITYPNNKVLLDELCGYEVEMSNSGVTTYSNGKSVQHDDSVIALALATLKYKESGDNGEDYSYQVYELEDKVDVDWKGAGTDNYSFDYNL